MPVNRSGAAEDEDDVRLIRCGRRCESPVNCFFGLKGLEIFSEHPRPGIAAACRCEERVAQSTRMPGSTRPVSPRPIACRRRFPKHADSDYRNQVAPSPKPGTIGMIET